MTQQHTDTLHTTVAADTAQQVVKHGSQLTPEEVISWLPKDATPAQMDSMVRKYIKPSEIHWSECPDTLHLPGHKPAKSFRNVQLPQYYRESFFSKDSLFHPELTGGRLGVAGDPIPYTIANDSFFVSILLSCFFAIVIAIKRSKHFIARQAKDLFRVANTDGVPMTETSSEVRVQVFLMTHTCLMLGLCYYFYDRVYVGGTYMPESYQVIAIYAGIVLAYYILRMALYSGLGWVFFERKKNKQWRHTFLFLVSMEGVALFPAVMVQTFFDLSLHFLLIYVVFVVLIGKMLAIYKLFAIFFKNKGAYLQLFLYFCALEIIPLLACWGVLRMINGYLKINF